MQIQFKRRITHGVNVTLAIIAFIGLVIFANYLVAKYPQRYDFIQNTDLYKLSDKTKNVLDQVKKEEVPLELYWFSKPGESELYEKVKRLFESYSGGNTIIESKVIDETADVMEARNLVRDLEIDQPDTAVIVYGDNKKILSEMDLGEFKFDHDNYTGAQIKNLVGFKAEQAITSAIIDLMNPHKIQARFTVKHGEKSIFGFDDNGYSEAKRYLGRDNIEAKPIELVALAEIALTNVEILVVAGPTRKFLPHEVNLIRNYLQSGGRGLFLLDPEIETGLEPVLREFNVKLGNDLVVDPTTQMPGVSLLRLVIGQYRRFPISDNLSTYTIYSLARSVSILNQKNDVNKAYDLALTSDQGWGETNLKKDKVKFNEDQDLPGEVSIAVAVENEKTKMRMVVIGDSEFASNRDFFKGANKDFFMNSVNWIVDRETLVAISPKTISERRRLNLTRSQMKNIRYLVIFIVPGFAILLGILVYFVRRK